MWLGTNVEEEGKNVESRCTRRADGRYMFTILMNVSAVWFVRGEGCREKKS